MYLSALAEFAAPFLFGVAVARAIAIGLVDPQAITLKTIVVAMAAALVWTLIAWWRGIPSSSSHALVGGLISFSFTGLARLGWWFNWLVNWMASG